MSYCTNEIDLTNDLPVSETEETEQKEVKKQKPEIIWYELGIYKDFSKVKCSRKKVRIEPYINKNRNKKRSFNEESSTGNVTENNTVEEDEDLPQITIKKVKKIKNKEMKHKL